MEITRNMAPSDKWRASLVARGNNEGDKGKEGVTDAKNRTSPFQQDRPCRKRRRNCSFRVLDNSAFLVPRGTKEIESTLQVMIVLSSRGAVDVSVELMTMAFGVVNKYAAQHSGFGRQ